MVLQRAFFGSLGLLSDEFREVGQAENLVEPRKIRLDLAGAHEVDSGEKHAEEIQQGFHAGRVFLLKEFPLSVGKSEVVVRVMPRQAGGSQRLEFLVLGRGMDDQWREQLFEDVAIFLEKEFEELLNVVGDEVDFKPVLNA